MLGIFGRMRGHPLVKFLGWEIRKARVTCLLGCDWWDNISQEWLGWAMPSLLVSPEMHLMHPRTGPQALCQWGRLHYHLGWLAAATGVVQSGILPTR